LKNDPEAMLILENTHEAIIDRKTFEVVQKHFEGRKRPDIQGEMDKYAGYLFCGECGARLYLHRAFSIDPAKNFFQCGTYQTKGKTHCTSHYINENVVDEIVLTNLRQVTEFARSKPEEFYAMAAKNGEAEAKKFTVQAEKEKQRMESRIKELDNIIRCLYEDRVTGRISPERYDTMAAGYEHEQTNLREELAKLTAQIEEMDLREKYVRDFIEKAKAYVEMPILTPELLRVFIKRIDIMEKEVKYSRTCGNTIIIHYTFEYPQSRFTRENMIRPRVQANITA
ncbi:MAG: recombinase zinc beta ribbon domain-containing protein, partial [Clostridia bacterium]|nr:recombinase zinc beta ribbon domain-containing protein [Clostridia bacterium]